MADNESAEARLREALIALDERLRSCGSLHTAEDAYDSFYQEIVSEALSAVGGEATKSEGETPPSDQTADRGEIVQAHDWIKSTLGHGESMCSRCMITNREAAVLGRLNVCSRPAALDGGTGE